jgi:signal peptidase II
MGGSLAPFPALEPWFKLVHWTNTGAAFGLLQGQAPLFVAIALVVIVAVLIYSRQLPADSWAVRICLGLMLGGAIGNLIDRVTVGAVLDFVDVYWRNHHFWAFNVADSAITVGVAGMLLDMIGTGGKARD